MSSLGTVSSTTPKTSTNHTENLTGAQITAMNELNDALAVVGTGNYDKFSYSAVDDKIANDGYWTSTEQCKYEYSGTNENLKAMVPVSNKTYDIIFYQNTLSFSMAAKTLYKRHARCILAF